MTWWQCALLGGGGGAVFELLALFQAVLDWQYTRKSASGSIREDPPRLKKYVDLPAHAWVFALRGLLGAVAAIVVEASGHFHGIDVALGAGCAAPTVLGRLGAIPAINHRLNQAAHGHAVTTELPGDAKPADTITSATGGPQ